MSYTEAPPLGPVPAGDVGGDDAVTEGFSRRFYQAHPSEPGRWLNIYVEFYYGREPHDEGKEPKPVTLNCAMECSVGEGEDYDNADEIYTETRFLTMAEFDGVPTEDDARAACAAFDPTVLTWDGTWPVPDDCWAV